MQAYLVLFSDDAGGLRVLRGMKRRQGNFFHGGEIRSRENPPVLNAGRIVNAGMTPVSNQNGQLQIGGKGCFGLGGSTVKIYNQLGRQHNIAGIGVFNAQRELEVTIYPTGFPIFNYPGQYVFPGGKVNEGEAGEAAAFREFLEETGKDLSHRLKYTHRFTDGENVYFVTYVKVPDAELNQMAGEITGALEQADYRDRICKTVTVGKVMDDELQAVDCTGLQSAIDEMSVTGEGERDRTWLVNAGTYLQGAAATMVLS